MTSQALAGIFRSLRIYHGEPGRQAAMDALYRHFLSPGDLAFDIGSHVGDRISSFRRLGARVVGLEPQPLAYRALRLIHGRDSHVTLLQAACGDRAGTLRLHVNSANPTVSTASADFVSAADGAAGWEGQAWDRVLEVPATTLDDLIAVHGVPAFVKIDVEGFEADVLAGLSQGLAALGPYRFNVALGESQSLTFAEPVPLDEMRAHIDSLPHDANSGDVYALLPH